MAEISYPFNADNPDGGKAIVSQTQWQNMSHMWGPDRVDYNLPTSAVAGDLPFSAKVVAGRQVEIKPGKAWVGGFFYQLTAMQTVTIASNSGTKPRKDIIVLQLDMAKSAVNLAVVKGTAAASPVAPAARRVVGGIWEMVLHEVDVAAQDASIVVGSRAPYNMPDQVAFPWNARESIQALGPNGIGLDLDANGGDSQYEAFNGRDGYVLTRHLGKARTWSPAIVNMNTPASVWREGHWRYIAPNVVWFTLYWHNLEWTDMKLKSGFWTCGLTLPVAASGKFGQVFTGHMDNNEGKRGDMPNFVSLTAKVNRGANSNVMWLYMQSKWTPEEGMDGVGVIPGRAYMTVTGTYEAANFSY
ncbi:hypothetical protein [Streptomyces sp. NPDC059874]|uniref:hypothetical protein n=1 Tax=Streptomyces sp. NPDC059874 TaxID=3346983 RepID=UPI003648CDF0